jgi:1,4-dihydroxy-2-naphthoate octaprenyltransferase
LGGLNINIEKIRKIIELGRLRFLAGGFFLYIMGSLLAISSGIGFSFNLFIFGYAIMLPAHLGLSYSNNYFDIEVDKHNNPISISGGSRILIENPDLRKTCLFIALVLMSISIILSVFFITIYNFSILFFLFILFANLLGFFYSAPPIKLAYRGFGEIANMINIGFLMPGIGYWIIKGSFDLFYFVFAFALFFYGLEFIILVEMPDMEGDKIGNKNTLIVKKGRKFGYIVILITLIISSIYYLFLSLAGIFSEYINYLVVFLISLIPLIVAIKGWFGSPFEIKNASKIAITNIMTLFLVLNIINIYLFVSIIFDL